jgi:O-antigen biosynthesis protein WbqP
MNYFIKKRYFDLFISSILLIILLFPIMIIYFILKFFYATNPIYFSKRVGKNNIIFLMPKFRTMTEDAPQVAKNKINNKYITRLGRLLRYSSLDELPQLFSVLSGKMSLVGPRPALFNQKGLILLRSKKKIHHLKPGITGWAQINGRDKISIRKKVELDYYYYNNLSLYMDIKIIIITFFKVFNFRNILR